MWLEDYDFIPETLMGCFWDALDEDIDEDVPIGVTLLF